MTTGQAVQLCSHSDTGSFLVPSYGFETADQALGFAASPDFFKNTQSCGPDDCYAPVIRGRSSYVPRVSAGSCRWHVSELVGSRPRFGNRPIWDVLRGKDTPKPEGAYNVALLVDGKRQFFRHHHHTTKHPKWWFRISSGQRDCFAVWSRKDGVEIGGGMPVDDCTRILAARSGRGVIYACTTRFDNSGKPCGFQTELVRVEFSILDRDDAKDDMLRLEVNGSVGWSDDPESPGEPWLDKADRIWVQLVEKAIAGFRKWCRPVPESVDQWRQSFLDQRARADTDSRTYDGSSFRDRIKPMDWQEALRLVQEPWQLQVVVGAHCNSHFDESGGCFDANYNRVGRMLDQHECSSERKAELQQMIADFVEPSDGLWNYTGD